MNVHEYNLHELKGDRKGVWSITVRANWRITLRFEDGYALDVNLEEERPKGGGGYSFNMMLRKPSSPNWMIVARVV